MVIFSLILALSAPFSHAVETVAECDAVLARLPADVAAEAPLGPEDFDYVYYDREAAETVVLIHGLDSAWQTFFPILGELQSRYNVLAMSQRGHGLTADRGFNYSTKLLARDILGLIDHLKIGTFHLLGHSNGAKTAIRLVGLAPDRVKSFIIEDMELVRRAITDLVSKVEASRRIADFPREYGSEEELRANYARLIGPQALPASRIKKNEDGSATLMLRPHVSLIYSWTAAAEDFTAAARALRVPTLVIGAEPSESAISPRGLEHLRQNIPHARIEILPGALHNVHGSRTKEFLRTLIDFVDRASAEN